MSNFNAIDAIVVLIFAFSMLIGLSRGFLKEAISLMSWVAAAFVAMTFSSPIAAHFSGGAAQYAQNAVGSAANVSQPVTMAALGITFVILFVGTLFLGSIVSAVFSGAGSLSGLGIINRILGAGFGMARGYLVVIVLMFLGGLSPLASQSAWGQSQFVADFQPTVQQFAAYVEPQLQSIKAMGTTAVQGVAGQVTSFTGAK